MPQPRFTPVRFNMPRFVAPTFAGRTDPPVGQPPTPGGSVQFAGAPTGATPIFRGPGGALPIDDNEFQRDPTEAWRSLPMSGRIRFAAHNLLVVHLRYRKLNGSIINRVVEPYSYRVRRPRRPGSRFTNRGRLIEARKPGGVTWYFFAWDQGANEIRSFLVRSILQITVGQSHYEPRYNVEF